MFTIFSYRGGVLLSTSYFVTCYLLLVLLVTVLRCYIVTIITVCQVVLGVGDFILYIMLY